jgi:hypothetical protein
VVYFCSEENEIFVFVHLGFHKHNKVDKTSLLLKTKETVGSNPVIEDTILHLPVSWIENAHYMLMKGYPVTYVRGMYFAA